LALILTIAAITYFSVVLGDLIPKRLALLNPEGIICLDNGVHFNLLPGSFCLPSGVFKRGGRVFTKP